MSQVTNPQGFTASVQISSFGRIESGIDFQLLTPQGEPRVFLIGSDNEEDVTAEVVPAGEPNEVVEVTIRPGWTNPYQVIEIKSAPDNLFYGR